MRKRWMRRAVLHNHSLRQTRKTVGRSLRSVFLAIAAAAGGIAQVSCLVQPSPPLRPPLSARTLSAMAAAPPGMKLIDCCKCQLWVAVPLRALCTIQACGVQGPNLAHAHPPF